MKFSRRFMSMALGAISLLLLGFVVAVAASSRPGSLGEDPLFEMKKDLELDLERLVGWIIFILAMIMAVLFALGRSRSKAAKDQKKRSFIAMILGVAAFFLIVRYFRPLAETLLGQGEVAAEAADATDRVVPGSGGAIGWVFSLLVAAVVAAALTRVGLTVRDSDASFDVPDGVGPTGTANPSLVGIPGMIALGDDPRSRVLSAYDRFERAAAVAGISRRSTETANRHAIRVSRELELSESEVAELMACFARTRFGSGGVMESDAETAEMLSDKLGLEMRP